jgi:hypothetical protein
MFRAMVWPSGQDTGNYFRDKYNLVPQSVLYLSKEEGRQGLVHLASKAAAFRFQFIQRLLYGPKNVV